MNMNFEDAIDKFMEDIKKSSKWPGVEPVDKELTKDCKPLYVDWHGDDNCTECFGEDCNTCAINLAHKYGTVHCDPANIDWPGDESCAECLDCDCENCSINLSHRNDALERFAKEQCILDIKYKNEEVTCIDTVCNYIDKIKDIFTNKNDDPCLDCPDQVCAGCEYLKD